MDFWNEPTLFAYGLTGFVIAVFVPIMILLFVVRIIGRSARKTVSTFRKR